MRHNREEVIQRPIQEFEVLDRLVASLTNEDWERLAPRPGAKEPWTVKDALAHITHWKADAARSARRQRRPPEERGLGANEVNHDGLHCGLAQPALGEFERGFRPRSYDNGVMITKLC